MNEGLEACKYLKENKRRHWLENDKSNECLGIIEKELIVKELAIDFIDRIADLFGTHDLEELEDKIVKQKKVLKTIKKAFKSSSTYTYKLKDSLECGWITEEDYDLLEEVLL